MPVLALLSFAVTATVMWHRWRRRQWALQGKRIAKAEAAAEEAQRLAEEESAAAAAATYEANRMHRSHLAQQRAEWEEAAARTLSGRAASVVARKLLDGWLVSRKEPPLPPPPTLQSRRRSLSGIFGSALALARTWTQGSEYKEEAGGRRRRRPLKALIRSWSRASESSAEEAGGARRRPLKALIRSWSRCSESSAEEAGGAARQRPLKALMRSWSRCSDSSDVVGSGACGLTKAGSRSWSRESGGGDGGSYGSYGCGRTLSGALERARSVSFHPSVSRASPPAAVSGEQNQSCRKHRRRRSKASCAANSKLPAPKCDAATSWDESAATAPAAEGTWSSAGWALQTPKRQQLTLETEARGQSDGAGGSQSSDSSPASSQADTPFDAARRELHGMLEGVEASIQGFVAEAKTEDGLIETCSSPGRSPSLGAMGAGVGLRLACTASAADIAAPASPQHRKRRRRTRGGTGHGHSSPTKNEVRV